MKILASCEWGEESIMALCFLLFPPFQHISTRADCEMGKNFLCNKNGDHGSSSSYCTEIKWREWKINTLKRVFFSTADERDICLFKHQALPCCVCNNNKAQGKHTSITSWVTYIPLHCTWADKHRRLIDHHQCRKFISSANLYVSTCSAFPHNSVYYDT